MDEDSYVNIQTQHQTHKVRFLKSYVFKRARGMGFDATFNNNSVYSSWSVLLVVETGVQKDNHQPVTNH